MTQLTFFTAGIRPPRPSDLEGLLAAAATVRREGGEASVSVTLPRTAKWRVDAATIGFEMLDLPVSSTQTDEAVTLTVGPSRRLLDLATRWSRGDRVCPPPGLRLDGGQLRWWAVAAGRYDPSGYTLGTATADDRFWLPLAEALAEAGIPSLLVGGRSTHPGFRITGQRRLRRLAELIGEPPVGAEPGFDWPEAQVPAR